MCQKDSDDTKDFDYIAIYIYIKLQSVSWSDSRDERWAPMGDTASQS